jgi:hypothetical protein
VSDIDNLKTAVQSAVIAAILGITALSIPEAKADYRGAGTGGTLCKAAAGPGANVFYFDNRYAQNTSASVQYLSCQFVDVYDATVNNASAINVAYGNPTAAAATFTCAVQSGADGYGITNTAIVSASAPAGQAFGNFFLYSGSTPAIPLRTNAFVGYSMSCAVPAQGKITIVEIQIPGSVTAP